MSEHRTSGAGEELNRLTAAFEEQLLQHRLESNRQQALIGELTRGLKEAQQGLHQLPLILGVATVVDRLDAYAGPDPEVAASIRDELLELLALNGVRPVEVTGPVNPSLHRVMRVEQRPNAEPGVVVEVWRRGYIRGDALVRHAEVVVNHRGIEDRA